MCFIYTIFAILLCSGEAWATNSYADIVDEIMPSVVNISTKMRDIEAENIENLMINKDFENRESLGSGFFISNDGHILTNEHVIKGAKKINIITNDNEIYEANLIGSDSISDLAVLKITPKNSDNFKPISWGEASNARIGDIILTIGNPYGLGVSVSHGIISAKSRNIGFREQQYIQTDAAINEGNSGGPMFNLKGEVIGVNSAIFKKLGATGVGFSLPSDIAKWISSQLIKKGNVDRGWIGFDLSYASDAKHTNKTGFLVTTINEESNAYKAGLRIGDIITHFDNFPADEINEFNTYIETSEIGASLSLKTLTKGKEHNLTVEIQKRPIEELKNIKNKALEENHNYTTKNTNDNVTYISEFMIAVQEVSPKGLEIIKIDNNSPFKNMGISRKDIILEADGADVYSAENLLDSIRNAVVDDYRPISFLIQSADNTFYATIDLVKEYD